MDLLKLMTDQKILHRKQCERYLNLNGDETDAVILERLKDWKLFEDGLSKFHTTTKTKTVINSGEEFDPDDLSRDKDYDVKIRLNVEKDAKEFLKNIS